MMCVQGIAGGSVHGRQNAIKLIILLTLFINPESKNYGNSIQTRPCGWEKGGDRRLTITTHSSCEGRAHPSKQIHPMPSGTDGGEARREAGTSKNKENNKHFFIKPLFFIINKLKNQLK